MTNDIDKKTETPEQQLERMTREWIACEQAELKSLLPDGQTLDEAMHEHGQI